MKFQMNKTGLVIFIAFIVAGIYDFGLVVFRGTGSSISAFMVDAGVRSPLWMCVLCLVIGHFVFGMKPVGKCPKCGEVVE